MGFASQSQSFVIDRLCFAKSIHFSGLALLRKAFPSWSDWLCFAKPILCKGLALLRKAFPSWSDWLCFAKPILCKGWALLRKANPLWSIDFASQSQFVMDWLCFAKPFHHVWLRNLYDFGASKQRLILTRDWLQQPTTNKQTDTTGDSTPQTGTSPRGLTSLSRAQERIYTYLREKI
jgi:hypothetical protein